MTTNSPNPVDADVQVLIEHINTQLDLLRSVTIKHVDEFQIEDIKMDIKVHEIALAALTAEPVAYTDAEELETLRKGTFADMFTPHESYKADQLWIPLYTTPPAQILRPVELPDCGFDAVSHMSGGSKDYCNGFVDGTNNAIKAIREAGYEVKS